VADAFLSGRGRGDLRPFLRYLAIGRAVEVGLLESSIYPATGDRHLKT
jgi:hypothetical protein